MNWIKVEDELPNGSGYKEKYLTKGVYGNNPEDISYAVCSYPRECDWFRPIGYEEYRYKITHWVLIDE